MARFSINKLPKQERIRLIGEFYDAMALIKNREESAKVFKDILDGDEIGNIMRRIDVAILLLLGLTYEEIVNLLGVGKNKISSVHRKLDRGGEGYRLLIQRILENRKDRKIQSIKAVKKSERRIKNSDVDNIKKRYAGMFMLWDIIEELGDHFEAQSEIEEPKKEVREHYRKRKTVS
jgi:TrpR-related protein YerC/YecD